MPGRFPKFPLQAGFFAIGLFAAVASPAAAQAQGLFEVIRGLFAGRGFLVPEEEPASGPYQAYCVRLCDGRFFPLPAGERRDRDREERNFFSRGYRGEERRPAARTAGDASADNLCKAMCPATPVKVFSGAGIENAVSGDGVQYVKLQNAFVYREKMIPECTCNGAGNAGLANLDPTTDPTLQPGDIVVTDNGPQVYRGGQRGQPASAAFVPVQEYRGLPERERRSLSEMRISRTPEPVAAQTGAPPAHPAPPGIAGTTSPAEDIMSRGFVP